MSLDPGHEMPRDDRDWLRWCAEQRIWQVFIKPSDQTKTTDITYAADEYLAFIVKANRDYSVRGLVWFDAAATPDFKFRITGPTTGSRVRIRGKFANASAAADTDFVDVAFATSHPVTGTGTNGGYVSFELLLQNGTDDGTVAFEWAQNTSDAGDTTVRSGSYLEVL